MIWVSVDHVYWWTMFDGRGQAVTSAVNIIVDTDMLSLYALKPQRNGPLYSSTVIGTLAVVPNSYYLMWHYSCLWTLKG